VRSVAGEKPFAEQPVLNVGTIDNTAPTVSSIVRHSPAGATTNADTLVYRVAFAEAVSNVSASDFTVSVSLCSQN
jgi:hypothetical protein